MVSRSKTTQINPEDAGSSTSALNLECAAKLGMRTIEMQTLDRLREELRRLGVD